MSGCPFFARSLGQVFSLNASGSNTIRAPTAAWAPPPLSKPSTANAATFQAFAAAVKDAVDKGELGGPPLCRLGFHSTMIASRVSHSNGANGGWHKFAVDRDFAANGGLPDTINYLMDMLAKEFPGITCADAFSFVGALGPELSGGPPVAWYPGRADSMGPGPSEPPLSAGLPDGALNATGVQYVFESLGLTVRETVIVCGGGHSFGGADLENSGWSGQFTGSDAWPSPGNKYFVDLFEKEWVGVINPGSGKPQYVLSEDGGKAPTEDTIFRLPSDMALKEADAYAKWARKYAADEALFTLDFQRTMQRLLQLGAGASYVLEPARFSWKGYNGDWEGFGTDVQPLGEE